MITTTNENRYYWLQEYCLNYNKTDVVWPSDDPGIINIITQSGLNIRTVLQICTPYLYILFQKSPFLSSTSVIVNIETRDD